MATTISTPISAPPLRQGTVRQRPPRGKAQAHKGVQPLSTLTDKHFEPLPRPLGQPPYHYDLETAIPGITKIAEKMGQMVFHTVGDTGGIKNADFQSMVAAQMKTDLIGKNVADIPRFFYHLGDVVYYNGEVKDYFEQFYSPYDHYDPPIFAIPGNHDGDPADSTQTSLDGWVRYFMSPTPHIDGISGDAPRVTMSLPFVYYTLNCPHATIVGMYTNVPEGGSVDSVQQQWFTNEFATAPKDKALIAAMHHPVYSFDDHHSGSPAMADVLEKAINDSLRVPNMVLTAHVHNYQRIEREIAKGIKTPFLVAGHGGYYHRHNLTADNGHVDHDLGAHLIFGDDKHHGYVTLFVDDKNISGLMTPIAETGSSKHKNDAKPDNFKYTAKCITIPRGTMVSL